MTPPLLTAQPARLHRRVTPSQPGQVHVDQAAEIRRRLAKNEAVTVTITGMGRGWFVLSVGDGTFEVWRDRSSLTVPWADVLADSI
ncbi:hypothetical protein AB0K35_27800 [Micromonospora sp. NPDC053740]|uniref:hypothetical protein n=1 Tax=Micromonospora sp. NPDC053740 TaxID=3155173 RepID=UPI003432AE59